MVTFGHSNVKTTGAPGLKDEVEENDCLSSPTSHHYGSISGDTCPTCRGTGRIPRDTLGENIIYGVNGNDLAVSPESGRNACIDCCLSFGRRVRMRKVQQLTRHDQLVAVISCNDKRLKPRHTKRYVCISMVVCILVSCLILFFLFPRTVTITPVSVQSVMVYFNRDQTLTMEVKNLINISNQNYVPIQIVEFDVQGLIAYTVRGRNKICNMTTIQSRSQKTYTVDIELEISEPGLNSYCRSNTIKIHALFLELQMTMNITYLSHAEQVSLNTFEYIDCGANSTIPHPMEGGRGEREDKHSH